MEWFKDVNGNMAVRIKYQTEVLPYDDKHKKVLMYSELAPRSITEHIVPNEHVDEYIEELRESIKRTISETVKSITGSLEVRDIEEM